MADQKTLNESLRDRLGRNGNNGRDTDAAAELGENVADLTHDVASLVELQSELFSLDLKEATNISLIPVIIGISGILLLLAAFPVLLIGLAYLMVHAWEISEAGAFFATGVGAVLISAGVVWIVWLRLCEGASKFQRSLNELKRNFMWLKTRLRARGARRKKST